MNIYVNGEWYYFRDSSLPLGEGAMGVVYIGNSKSHHEKVAIKKIKKHFSNNPQIRKRVLNEASLRFDNPHLVEMYGACEVDGIIYVVSKLVQGVDFNVFLSQKIRQMPSFVERICRLYFQILDALSYLHSRGILHLDIKPSNIMMENGCNLRLMDLGIACEMNKISNEDSAVFWGTPKYAAPEQFPDSPYVGISRATDIYQAAVTLYELLTGLNPFTSQSLTEASMKHASICLPYVKGIPVELTDVLRQAASPNPFHRFQNVNDFRNAIESAITKKKNVFSAYFSRFFK